MIPSLSARKSTISDGHDRGTNAGRRQEQADVLWITRQDDIALSDQPDDQGIDDVVAPGLREQLTRTLRGNDVGSNDMDCRHEPGEQSLPAAVAPNLADHRGSGGYLHAELSRGRQTRAHSCVTPLECDECPRVENHSTHRATRRRTVFPRLVAARNSASA